VHGKLVVGCGVELIALTISQPGISVALVGARNGKQVEENAGTAIIKLSAKEINLITNNLNQLKLV